MRKIHFIVNPISGNAKHKITLDLIKIYFNSDLYQINVSYTQYKKHAIALTHLAIEQQADIIVACGGDGTIHEVATELIDKQIEFAIVPVGSGNGLASNLCIPKDIPKALEHIAKGSVFKMDVGSVNGEYFFSNMGFGIDATIIANYEKSGKRKLSSYIKAALESAKHYKAKQMRVSYNGQTKLVNPLLLFISNSNEMGYKMSLTPLASLNDGLLDYLMVPKISLWKQLTFGIYVLLKKTNKFRKTDYLQTDQIQVEVLDKQKNGLQLDGEFYEFDTNVFKIQVHPGALKVIC
ncbi:diacylglycerol/lipid kinase family protein [Myroides sp. LJL119]